MARVPDTLDRLAKYLWASPNTALGMLVGVGVLLFGGRVRLVSGVIEFSDGRLARAFAGAPDSPRICAITFGHAVIGLNEAELACVRAHEHVHVRQYENWGPFFLPAYLLSSLWQTLQGRRAYRDNFFEREAYGAKQ